MFGTIKKVVKDKGFGFITPDDGGDEVFFHRSRLSPKIYFDDLREGTEVQFEVKPGEKGRQAFNLRDEIHVQAADDDNRCGHRQ